MLMHAIAHESCTDTVRESALKVDSGRKIPCRIGESNLPQRRAGPSLCQLSYIPAPGQCDFFVFIETLLNRCHSLNNYYCRCCHCYRPTTTTKYGLYSANTYQADSNLLTASTATFRILRTNSNLSLCQTVTSSSINHSLHRAGESARCSNLAS